MSEITQVKMDYKNNDIKTGWMIDKSGRYVEGIKSYLLSDGIPVEGVDVIINNAAKVLGYCPNPQTDEENKTTGIVIGKVQSGKTSNFITLAALAFDNGYSHVVVLGGTKKVLVEQNSERIKEYFSAMKDVIVLNTVDHKQYLTEESVNQFIKNGKRVIIVALKNKSQIGLLKNNVFSGDILSIKPTLIIDDEGDEASLNTLVKKGKKSATYLAIEELKEKLDRHSFISVTATPQANLLINSMDILSPNFGILVDPGRGYCGLDVFHGPNSKHIIPIPDNEESLLDNGVPESFYSALASFFVAAGIFKSRKKVDDKLSMLIHPSQRKIAHISVYVKTERIIKDWRLASDNKMDLAYFPLRERSKKEFSDIIEESPYSMEFEDVEDDIISAIRECGIHILNGDSVLNGADDFYDYNIYVGGALLGRGLTLKGLAVTYIIRTAKGISAADTVQQRARWFGYKTKYLDLCRVYAVKKIIKEFQGIRDHEIDLWETVRDANLQGTHFKDIARIFLLSDDLRMTRTSVAEADRFVFKPWLIQKNIQTIENHVSNNTIIIKQFREKVKDQLKQENFGQGAPYIILEGASFKMIKEEVLDKIKYTTDARFDKPVIDKLYSLLKKKQILPKIDVIWMRDGRTSRPMIEDGRVDNYMVGRRPEDKSIPAIYKGDRYQFVKQDVMQLQIHNIEYEPNMPASPTFALYIPKDYLEKLTNLVIRM